MSTQTPLFGNEASKGPAGDLFFALRPDVGGIARIAALTEELRTQHQIKAKAITPERLHVTLHYLGTYEALPDEVVALAHKAVESITVPPFDLAFDHAHSFPRGGWGKPFVLGMREQNPQLIAFYQQLHAPLKAAGFGKWLRSAFTPHVTLLYDKAIIADTSVLPVSWTAQEFVLLLSEPRKGHKLLGSWPLR